MWDGAISKSSRLRLRIVSVTSHPLWLTFPGRFWFVSSVLCQFIACSLEYVEPSNSATAEFCVLVDLAEHCKMC
jgi:hypothetical protein